MPRLHLSAFAVASLTSLGVSAQVGGASKSEPAGATGVGGMTRQTVSLPAPKQVSEPVVRRRYLVAVTFPNRPRLAGVQPIGTGRVIAVRESRLSSGHAIEFGARAVGVPELKRVRTPQNAVEMLPLIRASQYR